MLLNDLLRFVFIFIFMEPTQCVITYKDGEFSRSTLGQYKQCVNHMNHLNLTMLKLSRENWKFV